MPVAAKMPDYFGDIFPPKSNGWKIFARELFIKTLSTTLLQIVCKFMLHSEVIFKSTTGPEDIRQEDLQHEWVNICQFLKG